MVLSTGTNKIKTAVFISGTGSNLKSLINFSKLKKSPISINLIITNNKLAKGLKYGGIYKIKKKIINFKNKDIAEKKILKELKKNKIELICLAGFMKILSKNFIKNFKGKILNIHPSLLPKYKGLNTHRRVLENNETKTGCTVHYVNKEMDGGEIILQREVDINAEDNENTIARRVLKEEHIIYPEAIKLVLTK